LKVDNGGTLLAGTRKAFTRNIGARARLAPNRKESKWGQALFED